MVATWFPDGKAPSTAPFNLNHVQAIASRHEVKVIHVRLGGSGGPVSEQFGGVQVLRMPLSPRKPAGCLALVRKLRAELRSADVLHTMAFTAAAVAAPVQVFSRKPWVHTEHWSGMAKPSSVSRTWAAFSWLRYILKLPNAVTAVSFGQARQLSRFARRNAVSVVPNVVEAPSPLAECAGMRDGPLRLIFVGGLIARKRPGLAIEALRVLRENGTDARLTLVGDGPLRGALEQQIRDAGLGEHTHLSGLLHPDEVVGEMRESDMLILPTAHETFCMAAAEAIAMGLPAVVTDLPELREFLTPDNSVLVNGTTGRSFADAVTAAQSRFQNVPSVSISATLPTKFSRDGVTQQFSSIYAEVRRESPLLG